MTVIGFQGHSGSGGNPVKLLCKPVGQCLIKKKAVCKH